MRLNSSVESAFPTSGGQPRMSAILKATTRARKVAIAISEGDAVCFWATEADVDGLYAHGVSHTRVE
jgi:hypothetical protein